MLITLTPANMRPVPHKLANYALSST